MEAAQTPPPPPVGGGIQERIAAPRSIGGRQIRSNLRTTPGYSRPTPLQRTGGVATPRGNNAGLTFGGLTEDGLIQERMRWPARTGTEVMRTVASRVTTHKPSHYAMLGVSRDFTEAQLRKQYRLLALRYHPDAAARNDIDPEEAVERFRNMQQAYEVLSDPVKRRRYDLEQRLQHRREWRRAWGAPQLVDKTGGAEDGGETDYHGGGGECGSSGDGGVSFSTAVPQQQQEAPQQEPPHEGGVEEADLVAADRAEKARRWDAERLAWLQSQIEAQEASLSSGNLRARVAAASTHAAGSGRAKAAGGESGAGDAEAGGGGGGAEAAGGFEERLKAAKHEESEARARAAEAERALRQAKDKARRKAHEAKLRREAEEAARVEQMERTQREDEERALEVEARVRRQVEERAKRQGAEEARRKAAEQVLAAEERARLATLAAEEKAIKLQAELDSLQRKLEEAERAATATAEHARMPVPPADDDAEEEGEGSEEQVEQAVRMVEAVYREEIEEREWARRAVSASGDFPELPHGHPVLSATAVGAVGELPEADSALSELVKWVCIQVPASAGDHARRRSVLMDTPYGRFAVLIPAGLAEGVPLLVPVPASGAPTQIGTTAAPSGSSRRLLEEAKQSQLNGLLERGFTTEEAALYCDGTSTVDALAELISSDEQHALEHTDAELDAEAEAGSDAEQVAAAARGGPKGSNFCVIS